MKTIKKILSSLAILYLIIVECFRRKDDRKKDSSL